MKAVSIEGRTILGCDPFIHAYKKVEDKFGPGVVLNYELDKSNAVIVRATDASGNDVTKQVKAPALAFHAGSPAVSGLPPRIEWLQGTHEG